MNPTARRGGRTDVPSAPTPGQPRRLVCGSCSQTIEAKRLHWLLDGGVVWCSACVSRAEVRVRQWDGALIIGRLPALDRVVAYGDRDAIAALLSPGQPQPGITAGITLSSVAAACGSDQDKQSPSAGELRSPSTAQPARPP